MYGQTMLMSCTSCGALLGRKDDNVRVFSCLLCGNRDLQPVPSEQHSLD